MRYLTIALTKGRLAQKTLDIFEKVGITCEEIQDKNSRKLIFVNEELKLKFFLAKGPDVPTYVEYGAADIGITGKDTIMEEGRSLQNFAGGLIILLFRPYKVTLQLEGNAVTEGAGKCKGASPYQPADPGGNQISQYCKRLFL